MKRQDRAVAVLLGTHKRQAGRQGERRLEILVVRHSGD